jgi:hypothetical protein
LFPFLSFEPFEHIEAQSLGDLQLNTFTLSASITDVSAERSWMTSGTVWFSPDSFALQRFDYLVPQTFIAPTNEDDPVLTLTPVNRDNAFRHRDDLNALGVIKVLTCYMQALIVRRLRSLEAVERELLPRYSVCYLRRARLNPPAMWRHDGIGGIATQSHGPAIVTPLAFAGSKIKEARVLVHPGFTFLTGSLSGSAEEARLGRPSAFLKHCYI